MDQHVWNGMQDQSIALRSESFLNFIQENNVTFLCKIIESNQMEDSY